MLPPCTYGAPYDRCGVPAAIRWRSQYLCGLDALLIAGDLPVEDGGYAGLEPGRRVDLPPTVAAMRDEMNAIALRQARSAVVVR